MKERPKRDATNDEHYPMPPHEQPELHIEDGEVWLNTGVANFDGLCIGTGASRQEAIADAVKVLKWALDTLQGPPPIPK